MPIYLHHYAEAFCLLISIICYRHFKASVFLWFIPFIFLTLITELTATYIAHVHGLSNQILYKILTTVAFIFYLWVISNALSNRVTKKIFILLTILVLTIIIIQNLSIPINKFHREAYIAGSIFVIVYCFIYLYEAINRYDIDFRIEREPFFWIVMGLLFYYLVGAAFIVFINSIPKALRDNFSQIMRWLSLIMYGCFSVAFILCRKHNVKYSS